MIKWFKIELEVSLNVKRRKTTKAFNISLVCASVSLFVVHLLRCCLEYKISVDESRTYRYIPRIKKFRNDSPSTNQKVVKEDPRCVMKADKTACVLRCLHVVHLSLNEINFPLRRRLVKNNSVLKLLLEQRCGSVPATRSHVPG